MTHPALIERITRSLAYMLRHQPDEFDLEVDDHGYGELTDVIRALNERLGEAVAEDDVREAVESGDRQRYEIVGDRIRALYGHSIEVQPGEPARPPERLFVGVSRADADRARRYGLRPGRRRFLHLALTPEDALETAQRTAREHEVIVVRAMEAWDAGINFYDRISLFLSDPIPTQFLEGAVREAGRSANAGRPAPIRHAREDVVYARPDDDARVDAEDAPHEHVGEFAAGSSAGFGGGAVDEQRPQGDDGPRRRRRGRRGSRRDEVAAPGQAPAPFEAHADFDGPPADGYDEAPPVERDAYPARPEPRAADSGFRGDDRAARAPDRGFRGDDRGPRGGGQGGDARGADRGAARPPQRGDDRSAHGGHERHAPGGHDRHASSGHDRHAPRGDDRGRHERAPDRPVHDRAPSADRGAPRFDAPRDERPRGPDRARDERPRFDDRPRQDERPRQQHDERPRQDDRPRYDDRPRPDDRSRPAERPRQEERPRHDDRPRPDDRARQDDRPRHDDRPRQDDRPRYDDRPRQDDRPRYEEAPRSAEAPRGGDPRRSGGDRPRRDEPAHGGSDRGGGRGGDSSRPAPRRDEIPRPAEAPQRAAYDDSGFGGGAFGGGVDDAAPARPAPRPAAPARPPAPRREERAPERQSPPDDGGFGAGIL